MSLVNGCQNDFNGKKLKKENLYGNALQFIEEPNLVLKVLYHMVVAMFTLNCHAFKPMLHATKGFCGKGARKTHDFHNYN